MDALTDMMCATTATPQPWVPACAGMTIGEAVFSGKYARPV
jgi:hypothetical protein